MRNQQWKGVSYNLYATSQEKSENRATPHLRKSTAVGVHVALHWNWGDPEVKDWDFDTLEQQPQTMINADQCPYGCPLHCVHWMVLGGDKPLAGRGELSGIKDYAGASDAVLQATCGRE